MQLNPTVNFVALAVGQPICCSEGVPPNFMPAENANGSCVYYIIQSGDGCELYIRLILSNHFGRLNGVQPRYLELIWLPHRPSTSRR